MDIKTELINDPEKTIAKLVSSQKKSEAILKIQKEYRDRDRTSRDTQVGKTQVDKTLKNKKVIAVRIPINFAKKIVRTGTAFEIGKPVTLIPSTSGKLSELIKLLWKTNRIDSVLNKAVSQKKSETQSAIQFYIKDVTDGSLFMRIISWSKDKLGIASQAKEIKVALLENKNGVMSPYFDETGDMKAFVWQFKSKDSQDKDINNTHVWDETNRYVFDDSKGKMVLVDSLPHGFDRIPIVYMEQDQPEWFEVQEMIDRIETSMSKLGGSNDYSGHPMLKIFGTVKNAPDKDEDGKAWIIPVSHDDEGNEIKGDVEFLTNPNASDSNKLELDKLESFIYSISSTPNLSFDNVKGIGSVSGIALKLMFLDAMIKASGNEPDNRTAIERILNIFISGIVNVTNTGLKTDSKSLYYDVLFNSILPDDLKEAVATMSTAKTAGIVSAKTAVEYLGINGNVEEELALIASDAVVVPIITPMV